MKFSQYIGLISCFVALNYSLAFGAENDSNKATVINKPSATQTVLKSIVSKGPALNKDFASGVAAPFSGVIKNTLILAGGSNYKNNILGDKPEDTKLYYKDIYGAIITSKSKKQSWKKLGEMPEELANGAAAVAADSMYIIGGTNAKGDKAGVLELSLINGVLKCETISWLPVVISNHGAAVIDNYLYVVGGLQNNKPSRDVYRMNLSGDRKKWEKLPSLPEDVRIQPVVTSQKDASGKKMLYVWSGFTGWGKDAALICGGYKYDPIAKKWSGLGAPLKNERRVYLGGGNAVALGENQIIAFGGFDYNIFLESLKNPVKDYNNHEAAWYKHNQDIYSFNTLNNRWSYIGSLPNMATVHAGGVVYENAIYSLEGELKPGTNTNLILKIDM